MSILFEDCLATLTERFASADRALVISDAESGERLRSTLAAVLEDKEVLPLCTTDDALHVLFPADAGTMIVYEARNPANASVEFVARLRDKELRAPAVPNRRRYLVMVLAAESVADEKKFLASRALGADVVVQGPVRMEGFLDAMFACLAGSRPPPRERGGPPSLHTRSKPGDDMRKPRLRAPAYVVRGRVDKIRKRLTAFRRFKARAPDLRRAAEPALRPSLLQLVQAQAMAQGLVPTKPPPKLELSPDDASRASSKKRDAGDAGGKKQVRLSLPGASTNVRALLTKVGTPSSRMSSSSSESSDDEDLFDPNEWRPGDPKRKQSLRSDLMSSMNRSLEMKPEAQLDDSAKAVIALKRRETRRQSLVRKSAVDAQQPAAAKGFRKPSYRAARGTVIDKRKYLSRGRTPSPPTADEQAKDEDPEEIFAGAAAAAPRQKDRSPAPPKRGLRAAAPVDVDDDIDVGEVCSSAGSGDDEPPGDKAPGARPRGSISALSPGAVSRGSLGDLFGTTRRRASNQLPGGQRARGSFSMLPPAPEAAVHRGSISVAPGGGPSLGGAPGVHRGSISHAPGGGPSLARAGRQGSFLERSPGQRKASLDRSPIARKASLDRSPGAMLRQGSFLDAGGKASMMRQPSFTMTRGSRGSFEDSPIGRGRSLNRPSFEDGRPRGLQRGASGLARGASFRAPPADLLGNAARARNSIVMNKS